MRLLKKNLRVPSHKFKMSHLDNLEGKIRRCFLRKNPEVSCTQKLRVWLIFPKFDC